ncbi:hypothetical protein ACB092_01G418600 [Castanea dentata]
MALLILHAVKTKKNSYKTLITAEYTSVKVELAPNFEMVHIQQWIDFASFEIDSNILAFYGPKIGRAVYLPLTEEAATSLLKRELGAVNTRLASNTFMVGHSVLLADIATPCKVYLLPPSKMILDGWKRLYSNTKTNFREQEIPQFVLDECYDMELYEWKKVDITDEEQRERVSQMIEDYEPFEGQPLLDAKCFK